MYRAETSISDALYWADPEPGHSRVVTTKGMEESTLTRSLLLIQQKYLARNGTHSSEASACSSRGAGGASSSVAKEAALLYLPSPTALLAATRTWCVCPGVRPPILALVPRPRQASLHS